MFRSVNLNLRIDLHLLKVYKCTFGAIRTFTAWQLNTISLCVCCLGFRLIIDVSHNFPHTPEGDITSMKFQKDKNGRIHVTDGVGERMHSFLILLAF